ncbi:MAG TPA: protein translocase subunit SecF [Candidatus Paceibacterota bacterium]|nr:protein translocase subunit SecF [Candidatus Paceibacterota bacterium]
MNTNLMNRKQYFLAVPIILSALSLLALLLWGLKPGIDLIGGSYLEVSYSATSTKPTSDQVKDAAAAAGISDSRVQPTGATGFILRQRDLSNDEHQALLKGLGTLGSVSEVQFDSVGPTIGAELLQKAWIAIALVIISIIIFIAFAFRGVSRPVASWKYGVVAIVTLMHDILIPTGIFAVLGRFAGAEVDSLFIVALLTILGISINDTIVVFDRIRENLRRNQDKSKHEEFDQVVSKSILQTLTRSINTSVAVVIVLLALYILGPASTHDFALTLIVGMVAGTYSSIFLAAPLLVVWNNFSHRGSKKK